MMKNSMEGIFQSIPSAAIKWRECAGSTGAFRFFGLRPADIIPFGRNNRSRGQLREQLRELTAAIERCAPHLLIAAGREGGR